MPLEAHSPFHKSQKLVRWLLQATLQTHRLDLIPMRQLVIAIDRSVLRCTMLAIELWGHVNTQEGQQYSNDPQGILAHSIIQIPTAVLALLSPGQMKAS